MLENVSLLIVDDDGADLELLSRIASDAFPEADVSTLNDAAALGEACADMRPDCLLLDYKMPGKDGLAWATDLRRVYPYLPIVLSTSVGDEMLAARAIGQGATDYIPKSRITPKSLRRTIENARQIMRQTQIIDEQRAELENFAYALAHDFKQPIRQIRTFSALVRDAVQEKRFDDLDQHLDFLSNAAGRLGRLVDVMSQYTLLNKPPEIAVVDLNVVLQEVVDSLSVYIKERNGSVTIAPMPVVRGNETLLGQVLQNLIVNGLKYNTNEIPVVKVFAVAQANDFLIEVSDNGIGIEPQYVEEIFKPLVRLHNNSDYSGTGLGLTLARKAVLALGGDIWCQSQPESGSRFYIRIKAATPN